MLDAPDVSTKPVSLADFDLDDDDKIRDVDPVLAKLIEIRQKAEEESRKADEERRKADEDIATHIKEQERVEKERQKAMEAKAKKKRSKKMTQSVSY
jgi:uncharacterized membrane protein YukC